VRDTVYKGKWKRTCAGIMQYTEGFMKWKRGIIVSKTWGNVGSAAATVKTHPNDPIEETGRIALMRIITAHPKIRHG
jgi:hypothetical protein